MYFNLKYTTSQRFGLTSSILLIFNQKVTQDTLNIYEHDICRYAAKKKTRKKNTKVLFMESGCFEELKYKVCSIYLTLLLFPPENPIFRESKLLTASGYKKKSISTSRLSKCVDSQSAFVVTEKIMIPLATNR